MSKARKSEDIILTIPENYYSFEKALYNNEIENRLFLLESGRDWYDYVMMISKGKEFIEVKIMVDGIILRGGIVFSYSTAEYMKNEFEEAIKNI